MRASGRCVFASMAMSLDGYIVAADGDLSWLNESMRPGEDYGLSEAMARTGVYIMGANTFREAAGMMGRRSVKPIYVVTHSPPENAPAGVTFYSGDLRELVAEVQAETDGDVNVFGGGDLVTQLLAIDALDEVTLAIVPVVLGGGRRLFRDVGKVTRLQLTDCRSFDSGIVLLRYERAS